jgi:hypothetical protein
VKISQSGTAAGTVPFHEVKNWEEYVKYYREVEIKKEV